MWHMQEVLFRMSLKSEPAFTVREPRPRQVIPSMAPPNWRGILRNMELVKIIREIHAESRGSYGSPRVHAELRLGKDMQVNRKRAGRLMRE